MQSAVDVTPSIVIVPFTNVTSEPFENTLVSFVKSKLYPFKSIIHVEPSFIFNESVITTLFCNFIVFTPSTSLLVDKNPSLVSSIACSLFTAVASMIGVFTPIESDAKVILVDIVHTISIDVILTTKFFFIFCYSPLLIFIC